jgi:hypothetical protein
MLMGGCFWFPVQILGVIQRMFTPGENLFSGTAVAKVSRYLKLVGCDFCAFSNVHMFLFCAVIPGLSGAMHFWSRSAVLVDRKRIEPRQRILVLFSQLV